MSDYLIDAVLMSAKLAVGWLALAAVVLLPIAAAYRLARYIRKRRAAARRKEEQRRWLENCRN